MPITEKQLQGLKVLGKIKGYSVQRIPELQKKSKYGNKKVEFDGYVFDSKRELSHYLVLRMMAKTGVITDLKLQVAFELNDGGTHSLKYIADFTYMENGVYKVVDVKGYKTKIYLKKKKLMKKVHGIEIIEI